MTLLSDGDIAAEHEGAGPLIVPFDPQQVQPCSYDVRLMPYIRIFSADQPIDPRNGSPPMQTVWLENGYWLKPGQLVIGSTKEQFAFSASMSGRFEGKSTLGRIGLSTHITAGFFDAGFRGNATVEIKNEQPGLSWWKRVILRHKERAILLYPGMEIGQMSFMPLSSPALRPYGHPDLKSKYQDQRGPTAARPAPVETGAS